MSHYKYKVQQIQQQTTDTQYHMSMYHTLLQHCGVVRFNTRKSINPALWLANVCVNSDPWKCFTVCFRKRELRETEITLSRDVRVTFSWYTRDLQHILTTDLHDYQNTRGNPSVNNFVTKSVKTFHVFSEAWKEFTVNFSVNNFWSKFGSKFVKTHGHFFTDFVETIHFSRILSPCDLALIVYKLHNYYTLVHSNV